MLVETDVILAEQVWRQVRSQQVGETLHGNVGDS